jgi:proline iminopeptidase
LVEDLERLRAHLGITRWVVFGGSWGSTLALAYALAHPAPVSALILRGIFLCRSAELNWFFCEVRHFFPEAWERFVAPAGNVGSNADLLDFYREHIFSSNPDVAVSAAMTWSNFEADIMSLLPGTPSSSAVDNEVVIGRARVQLHYLSHQGFIDGDLMLARIDEIRHIPTKIIQGRYDMVCPPCTAHELHQAWPEAQFMMIPDAGHSAMEPGTVRALMLAAQSFAQAR